jgi:hypothetical protein
MKTYKSDGFRPVQARCMADAARIFAGRLARRHHGKRGHVVTFHCDSWSENGRMGVYEAFVGHPGNQQGETIGGDVRIVVTAD